MQLVVFALLVVAAPAVMSAQSPSAQPARQDSASVLGSGWSALGNQQPARALEIAQQLLRAHPTSHDALSLALAALVATNQPVQALDAYDKWFGASRHEDIYLLQPVATGVLRQLALSAEPRVKLAALAALAEAGDSEARRQLDEAVGDQAAPAGFDAELAASGDQAAIARLQAQIGPSGARDKSSAIDALARANVKAATPALIEALKDPAPPSRMAAANALADLEAHDAIPALKAALNDPDPAVRQMIGVALARLGDESGGVTMESLAASPIGDMRLIAARNAARANPQGAWAGTVEGLLKDPDPLLRLKAARLLLESGRQSDAAAATLAEALTDQSPALRTEAARVLREIGQQQPNAGDPASLRRLLRDRLPDVQIEAARGLLALIR